MNRTLRFVSKRVKGTYGSMPDRHNALIEASNFMHILKQRQGLRIAGPEEIALRLGYITVGHFGSLAQRCASRGNGEYLLSTHRSFQNVALH